jgi:DNA transposition AAA+ family ATPase
VVLTKAGQSPEFHISDSLGLLSENGWKVKTSQGPATEFIQKFKRHDYGLLSGKRVEEATLVM